MKEKFIQNPIGETLLIPLIMKSHITKSKNPIITDKVACELVDKIDYDFNKFNQSIFSLVGIGLRVRYFDNKVKSFIQNRKKPIIVLLGCGLEARVTRIGKIGNKTTFYQLDIPEVMKIRENLMQKNTNETYIHCSMFQTDWMQKLKENHPNGEFLFAIEGVLMYFNEEQISSFFKNIAKNFNNSELLFDLTSVWASKNSNKHDAVKLMDAPFNYGTDDDKQLEKWAKNLKYLSTTYYTDFSEWKQTGFKGWLMRIIPKFKKAQRILHYQIN